MVAKSFQSMTQICEPYKLNGREYVKVRNEKTGTVRQVRWYSQSEYAKLYPETESVIKHTKPQSHTLGFEKGYITIFKGNIAGNQEWFEYSNARFAKYWGWYIISTEEIPYDLPEDVTPVKLYWEQVGKEDGWLKSEVEVLRAVNGLLFEQHPSEHQGNVGDRLSLKLTVISATKKQSTYGAYTTHIFEDDKQNQYVWVTSAKSWKAGETKVLRGTVKEHTIVKNIKRTVLTRCALIK